MAHATTDNIGASSTVSTPPGQRTARPARTAGVVALAGVGFAVLGTVFNQVVVDADLFGAMETSSGSERAELLTAVAADQTPLVIGLVLWVVGFPLVALASVLLARLSRPSSLTAAVTQAATASFGAILVFLSMFLAFPVVLAPAHVAGHDVSTLAHTIGFAATTIDWVVTAIVLGLAPIGAVLAGRGTWAPKWLMVVAAVAGAATALGIVGLVTDHRDLTFPMVPIGLILVAAAGVRAMRAEAA